MGREPPATISSVAEPAFPPCEIASARDGAGATLRGTVKRATDALLRAPISDKPCVYWEVNRTLGGDGAPQRFDGVDFWIEDASGRALVRASDIDVAARAERRTEAVRIIDAGIQQVSTRIGEIKRERREAFGATARALHDEHKKLKKLATLLCAIGAHARGNVHVGGTLERQETYIRERSAQFDGGGGDTRALELARESFEVVLEEGAEVEVSGLCVVERIPPGLSVGGGYRDTPTCLHVRAPAGKQLLVRGLGDTAPTYASADDGSTAGDKPGLLRRIARWLAG